jgi:hypothetical protein
MSKRKRSIEGEWYDLFADWELPDQEAAIRTLTELHRQGVRRAQRRFNCTCESDPMGRCVVHTKDPAAKETPATGLTLATALTKEQG